MTFWEKNILDGELAEKIQLIEHLSSAYNDGRERIFGHRYRQACFISKEYVETSKKASASGEDNPTIHNIGGQFGRRALKCASNGLDDCVYRLR